MSEGFRERNAQVIADFRANGGYVGGDRPGRPILLLTIPGRRTGQLRTNPLLYLHVDNRYFVFASHSGAPDHPEWYLNLVVAESVTVEVPGRTFTANPQVILGEERDRLFALQVNILPQFADSQAKTERMIPVIALLPDDEAVSQ